MTNLEKLQQYSANCKKAKQDQSLRVLEAFKKLLPDELRDVFTYTKPFVYYDGAIDFEIMVDGVELKVEYNQKTNLFTIQTSANVLWKSNYDDFHQLVDYIVGKLRKK